MKILRFSAVGMHGYLDFDLRFNDDLTYLTGINGCGKTSVLRAIIALITPSFINLASIEHNKITVEIHDSGKKLKITSVSDDDGIKVSVTGVREKVLISYFVPDPDEIPSRQYDEELDHYIEQERFYSSSPVMEKLRSLPTPMFLGLERRAQDGRPRRPRNMPPRRRDPLLMRRNIFGATLTESLGDTARLTGNAYRNYTYKKQEISDELKETLILRAFDFTPGTLSFEKTVLPKNRERKQILSREETVKNILKEMEINDEKIHDAVSPFFENLRKAFSILPESKDFSDFIADEDVSDDRKAAAWNWMMNSAQFERMNDILDLVEKYAEKIDVLNLPFVSYRDLVNRFLLETGKEIFFNKYGNLRVLIGGEEERPIDALSSGERQIVVLLSHIAFHEAAMGDNVLIIDEPELSLHVSWQEIFTESIRRANPHIQLIFATHSPAIILDDVEKCLDLSGGAE